MNCSVEANVVGDGYVRDMPSREPLKACQACFDCWSPFVVGRGNMGRDELSGVGNNCPRETGIKLSVSSYSAVFVLPSFLALFP